MQVTELLETHENGPRELREADTDGTDLVPFSNY